VNPLRVAESDEKMMNSLIPENLTFRMIQVEEEPLMAKTEARIAAALSVVILVVGTLVQVQKRGNPVTRSGNTKRACNDNSFWPNIGQN
jgi:hypothetical protein